MNRELAQLAYQRYQTPGGNLTSAGAGGTSGTFSKDDLPPAIAAMLNPFRRRSR